MKLKALIFDVDGTLADTEKDGHLVAFNLAFKDANLDWFWSVELYGELLSVTGGKERIKHYISKYAPRFDIGEFSSEDEFIANLHKEKTKYYVSLIEESKVPLRIGVERLLLEAREKGVVLAVSTTTTYDNVTALLSNTLGEESIKWFDVIGAGDIVKHKKPASDIYEWVLKELNLKADECVAIEDSYNGLVSSKDANIKTLITINEYTKEHNLSRADVIVDSLGDEENVSKIIQGDKTSIGFVDIAFLERMLKGTSKK